MEQDVVLLLLRTQLKGEWKYQEKYNLRWEIFMRLKIVLKIRKILDLMQIYFKFVDFSLL